MRPTPESSVPDVDDEPIALGYAHAAAHREALDPVTSRVLGLLPVVVIPSLRAVELLAFEEVAAQRLLSGGVTSSVHHCQCNE